MTSLAGADRPHVAGVGLIAVVDDADVQVHDPLVVGIVRMRSARPVVVRLDVSESLHGAVCLRWSVLCDRICILKAAVNASVLRHLNARVV